MMTMESLLPGQTGPNAHAPVILPPPMDYYPPAAQWGGSGLGMSTSGIAIGAVVVLAAFGAGYIWHRRTRKQRRYRRMARRIGL